MIENNSLRADDKPAMMFYVMDWLSKDSGLRLCSLAARGLWVDMLCIMWLAKPRGTLTSNGITLYNKDLARLLGETQKDVNKYITELESRKVFSRLKDGTIISRRMHAEYGKRDEIAKKRSEAGKKGMESRWQESDNKIPSDVHNKTITKITSSFSSSISSSKDKEKDTPKKEFSAVDIDNANDLIAGILKNDPKAKVPKPNMVRYDAWINEFRLMRERDQRTGEEIRTAMHFCLNDSFWIPNIRSAAKFRKQLPTLLLQAKRDHAKRNESGLYVGASKKKSLTDEEIAFRKAYAAEREKETKKHEQEYRQAKTVDKLAELDNRVKVHMAEWSKKYHGEKNGN